MFCCCFCARKTYSRYPCCTKCECCGSCFTGCCIGYENVFKCCVCYNENDGGPCYCYKCCFSEGCALKPLKKHEFKNGNRTFEIVHQQLHQNQGMPAPAMYNGNNNNQQYANPNQNMPAPAMYNGNNNNQQYANPNQNMPVYNSQGQYNNLPQAPFNNMYQQNNQQFVNQNNVVGNSDPMIPMQYGNVNNNLPIQTIDAPQNYYGQPAPSNQNYGIPQNQNVTYYNTPAYNNSNNVT